MRVQACLLLLCLLPPVAISAGAERSLDWLQAEWQSQWHQSGDLTAARLENRELRARLKALEAQGGWRVFAGTSYGRFRQPEFPDSERRFTGGSFQAGLRYPLLGSRATELNNQRDVRLEVIETEAQAIRAGRLYLGELQEAYIELWHSQARYNLMQAYSAGADNIEAFLAKRQRAGEMLASDQQRYLAELDEAGIEQRFQARRKERLQELIQALFPRGVEDFKPVAPLLPERALPWTQTQLHSHPQLQRARSRQSILDDQARPNWSDAVNANLTLAGRVFDESDLDARGNDLVVGLSVDLPLSLAATVQARRQEARALRHRARWEYMDQERELRHSLSSAWGEVQQQRDRASAAASRVAVAERSYQERRLRAGRLGGEAVNGWLDARSAYLRAALAWIDQRRDALLATVSYVELLGEDALAEPKAGEAGRANFPAGYRSDSRWPRLRSGPDDIVGDSAPPAESPDTAAQAPFAIYLWDSSPLLNAEQRPALLRRWQSLGVGRVLIGLTAEQVAGDHTELAVALEALSAAGLRGELLLGDPRWILPDHRRNLLAIIDRLAGLPFHRLHLDIEPEQLEPEPSTEIQRQWLDTLAAATARSPWPVAISIHLRWFSGMDKNPCVPCELDAAQVDEVVLMIYIRNQDRVSERASTIARQFPGLRFSVAQSAEATLPAESSYADLAEKDFLSAMQQLKSRLPDSIRQVYWQAWHDVEMLAQ